AQQELKNAQRERLKERERLRESLLEQARAERTAGRRWEALAALTKALELRADDDVRLEATATIVRPGLRALPEQVPLDEFFSAISGLESLPRLSPDQRLLLRARQAKDKLPGFRPGGIEILEWPSGNVVAKRSGLYLPIGFRPGTGQVTLGHGDSDQ